MPSPLAPRQLLSALATLTASLVLGGCDADSSALMGSPMLSTQHLTRDVAAQLNSSGRFARAIVPAQPFPQISYLQAERIADAYVRTFGVLSERGWSVDAGARVDSRKLRRCGPTLFAQSAYGLTGQPLPTPLRNFIAGSFLTHFCSAEGIPQLFVAVSEAARDLAITVDGRLKFPSDIDPSHLIHGQVIPREVGRDFAVVSPERAAELVHQASGRRVAEVPLLVRAPFPLSPMFSRYRVKVDGAVFVVGQTTLNESQRAEFFVGLALGVHSAATPLVATDSSAADEVDQLPAPFSSPNNPTLIGLQRRAIAPKTVESWTTRQEEK